MNSHWKNKLFNIYVLLNLMIYLTTVHTKSELVPPQERTTGLRCIPEGRNVSYQCTVIDASDPLIGSTVWLGNALDCPSSSSQISLQHSQFKSGSRMICGASFASFTEKSITLMEYTSVLNLTAAKELDGKMINCSLSGSLLIGSDTIRVGALPPPPGSLMVNLSSESSLTVSWSPPSGPVEGGVGGYVFSVPGEVCGCVSMTSSNDTTSVTCSGWTAAGQTCSFEVRTLSRDCGFTSDTVNTNVSLRRPPAPTELLVRFTLFRNNTVQVEVEFMGVAHLELGANLNSTVVHNIMVTGENDTSWNFTDVVCEVSNKCTFVHNISNLLSPESINISVVASNIFGSGPPTYYIECDPGDLGMNPTLLTFKGPGIVRITNGTVNYTGVTVGSVAVLDCDEGYRPTFDLNRTCLFTGQWSEGTLSCELMSTEDPSGTKTSSCPSSCVIAIAAGVFVFMVLLVILCIVLFVCIVCKFRKTEKGSKSEKQVTGNFTPADTTFASQDQPGENTTSECDSIAQILNDNTCSEEPSHPQLDNYAQPEDLIPNLHLPKQRIEGENTVHKVDHGGVEPVQYESIQEIRSSKPSTPHDPPRELYSEVFDALPKGKSPRIVNKTT